MMQLPRTASICNRQNSYQPLISATAPLLPDEPVRREDERVDHVTGLEAVEVLAVVKVPKHRD
jgi:hypothetical protein